MANYICIHGHFYQPPRENPWLEEIETQDSAFPYHDWNERINDECYLPNSGARILNVNGQITEILNNYSKICFNFGPTLLSWIEEKDPQLLESILAADKESQKQFEGHGNALAQAYNHLIMPLANSRDKYTQLLWGIKTFEHYFKRKPEGLWLSETAVDLETLDFMSELGIQFTILAPNQARRYKHINDEEWIEGIIPGTSYQQQLPSGRSITLFFYDGEVSKAVAFEKLLTQGENFAYRLLNSFSEQKTEHNLMHIATDGESYGHHHAHGDMGLAYALNIIENTEDVELINYGYFLELQPPQYQVEIHENSSWSCAHGIERWRSDCGCSTRQDWHQQWRGPLRSALDWLRDQLIPAFETSLKTLLHDPWRARNDYIEVLNDRSKQSDFLKHHARHPLSALEEIQVLKWMELQRHTMLMYTSCGWFFDEISGLETTQILKYAARAIQLAKELTDVDYESEFIDRLSEVPSNLPEFANGARIYELFIKPLVIDLFKVSAHLAVSLPFSEYKESESIPIFCYEVNLIESKEAEAGKVKLFSGLMNVRSQITRESIQVWYALLYQGDQNLICAIRSPDPQLGTVENELFELFEKGEIFELVKLFEQHFGEATTSLRDLFHDMKLKITGQILSSVTSELENRYHEFMNNNAALLYFISDLHMPMPKAVAQSIAYIVNKDLFDYFNDEERNPEVLENLFQLVNRFNIPLDDSIRFRAGHLVKHYAIQLENQPVNTELLTELVDFIKQMNTLPLQINYWHLQNVVKQLLAADNPNPLLKSLGEALNLEV
ncbi:DUF3536 domain-containing protein [Legionella quinlivanii]|uniref:DUF3536 domain-containing protein n=1 Tax=Legionella quinlivanii TaxID=45073 RepID=UPI0022431BC6|nr:DUF3536 domain-containing protein [Legionella quinlivanii]MCW8451470.1 DUF3536 domain-containing protein [Legionella quinlivanii]